MKQLLFIRVSLLLLVFAPLIANAQKKTITGNITSDDGGRIPGVTILIKSTKNAAVSDFDGNYSIQTAANSILIFSYLGMESQEIQVNNKDIINVVMKTSNTALDEVVVVGYGTQKKSDVTGSVVSISANTLESRPKPSLEQMLQGTTAGLNITVNGSSAEGSSNTLQIRGENSITASNSPLIILDGIPFFGTFSEINPKDVASIEVLKDASASAIYGSRGANGVLIITSKLGKVGKLTVNYSVASIVNQPVNIPKLMSGATFYETKVGRGLSTSLVEDQGYAAGRDTNWVDLATKSGITMQQDLSFSGGTEKTKYYVSMSYLDSEGIALGDEFKRYTFRINLNQKLTPWLTFNTSTQYGYHDRSGSNASFSNAFTMSPLGVPFKEDGSYTIETWDDGVYSANPLGSLLYDNSDKTRRFTSNNYLQVDFPFIKGLSFKFNTGYDYSSRLQQTYRGRNTSTGLSRGGSLDDDNQYTEDWVVENILSYTNKFGKHALFLTGLYSAQSEWAESHDLHAENFPNDVKSYYQASNGKLIVPSTYYSLRTHISQMFRSNYAFDSRYLLTLTVRRDGYSAFGSDSKFGVFPSAALGWNISNEKFMENVASISKLKLRLSYGQSGNEGVSPYATLPTLTSNNYVDTNDGTLFGFYPNRLGDPTLGWETTSSFNFGLDFGFLNNRISGLIDVYFSKTSDLLLSKSISNVNGTGSIIQNIGATSNNGIEFQISSVNVHKNNFKWTTDFNISHYDTKIDNVGLTDANGNYIDDVNSQWFIGQSVSVNYDYVFDGIYQENMTNTPQGTVTAGQIKYLDANEDGVINTADKRVIGRKIPDFMAGMTNTFEYKNFTLSFFLNMVSGITQSNSLLYTNDIDLRQNRYDVEFWTPENKSNTYPRNDRHASVNPLGMNFYRSTDFIRLQDITISYKFPGSLMKKLNLNNLEIYTNIKNLYTNTNWVGLDPEFSKTDSQQTAAPQTTSVLLGLKLGL